MKKIIVDDLNKLLGVLPTHITKSLWDRENSNELLEVVIDLGRPPEARFPNKQIVLNPAEVTLEDIEHVVGLEHLDTEDVHLRRSANLEGSTTFTKKFSKGDVLFGRRRAYLKKAAQTPL